MVSCEYGQFPLLASMCNCVHFVILQYHWAPFDQNLWTKLHDPWWLAFNVILCLPSAICHAIFYSVLFALIARSDEYQLIEFIRSYKAFQFFSAGVLGLLIGALMYVHCLFFMEFPSTAELKTIFSAESFDGTTADWLQETAHTCRTPRQMRYFAFDFEMAAYFYIM